VRIEKSQASGGLGLIQAGLILPRTGSAQSLDEVREARGLLRRDLAAAAKTEPPASGRDEFIAVSCGGPPGQILVSGGRLWGS